MNNVDENLISNILGIALIAILALLFILIIKRYNN